MILTYIYNCILLLQPFFWYLIVLVNTIFQYVTKIRIWSHNFIKTLSLSY